MDWQLVKIAIAFVIGGYILEYVRVSYRYDGYPSLSDELKEAGEDLENEIRHLKKEIAKLKREIEKAKQLNAEKEE